MRMTRVAKSTLMATLVVAVFVLGSCSGTSSTSSTPSPTVHTPVVAPSSSPSGEQPVAPVSNTQASASDIPDTQTFVAYRSSPGGYQLDVPEGWARTTTAANVNFVSNLNSLQVIITRTSTAPTAGNVRTNQAVTLQQNGRAVRDVKVQDVQ